MKKIMIVDDNYLSAEGIEKNIDWETLNAEIIHVCYNGTSAIEAMKKEPADLIISDIEMPDLDGISMSRQALEINPMVKIILISAYDKFEYARRALLLGGLYRKASGLCLSYPEGKKRFCTDGKGTEKSPASETKQASSYGKIFPRDHTPSVF